jgi:hypothetical protein
MRVGLSHVPLPFAGHEVTTNQYSYSTLFVCLGESGLGGFFFFFFFLAAGPGMELQPGAACGMTAPKFPPSTFPLATPPFGYIGGFMGFARNGIWRLIWDIALAGLSSYTSSFLLLGFSSFMTAWAWAAGMDTGGPIRQVASLLALGGPWWPICPSLSAARGYDNWGLYGAGLMRRPSCEAAPRCIGTAPPCPSRQSTRQVDNHHHHHHHHHHQRPHPPMQFRKRGIIIGPLGQGIY